jgi:proteasome activator subunit 4
MQLLNEISDSVQVTKSLSLFGILVDALGIYSNPKSEPYVKLLFENANTGYAEVRI